MKTERQGPDDWEDLIGTTFEILRDSGLGVIWEKLKLETIHLTENEYGAPTYYLLDEHWEGYPYGYTDIVEVRNSA